MLKRLSYLLFGVSFTAYLTFGLLFSFVFKFFMPDSFDLERFFQVVLMAFLLSAGALLGFRARSKSVLQFLESADLTLKSTNTISQVVELGNVPFRDVVTLISATDMPISFIDEARGIIKFREKFKLEKGNFQPVGFMLTLDDEKLEILSVPIYKDNMAHLNEVSESVKALFSALASRS